MGLSSIVMMVVGMVIIWGGLAGSIAWAMKKSKEEARS
ncbi:flagellar basal body-associated protein FliL [Bacillus tianshenii]|uniref:Flagellar basal body-associated protein FliL n=1 Tax=Sutcliffiella tianshenii TaxID=1463404 RepID=A0ABS2P4C0_9BACI|nr:methionine/alanine import family NSS transporter small subunit [Bacillus tianshenii]MBM7621821.1 flagellar basal body-associated protein FliL [Bacillus tianshenii]